MPASKTELLFHPIRARIIVEISGGRQTAKELAEIMPNVPKTTLYRHIRALADGGILKVVEEIPIRGTVERVYALDMVAADPSPEELDQMSREDFEHAFTLFVTGLLGDFTRYLDSRSGAKLDVAADGLRFGKAQIHLTESEYEALLTKVYGALEDVLSNEPAPGRKRRLVSITFIPTGDA
ncbi:MAG TPA: helix-turn-helix domain-containing protein [Anaerolineae bacterium]|jgi:DNA-binding transcriptional ArsR family regulator|nr:helix-turn-helix domain-containing protein [Anaerolineae bacterium]